MVNKVRTFKTGLGLNPISADPSGPVEGQLQFSDGTHRTRGLWEYKGSNWRNIKLNTSSTSDPTVNEDETALYEAGSIHTNTSSGESFICSDATTGAAVWTSITDIGAVETFLTNDSLLTSGYWVAGNGMPTSNRYGWNISDTGSDYNLNYVGSIDMTKEGAGATLETNHLGNSARCDFDDGSLYSNNAAFDTANESFTCTGWFNPTTADSVDRYFFAKMSGTAATDSFECWWDTSESSITMTVHYDTSNTVTMTVEYPELFDGNFHHLSFVYDQANTLMFIVADGKIIACTYDANLATRNNSSSAYLTIGSEYQGSSTWGNRFNGAVCDCSYYRGALNFNQIRRLYVHGTEEKANVNQNSRVRIRGENYLGGFQINAVGSDVNSSATGYVDALLEAIVPFAGTWKVEYECTFLSRETSDSASISITLADGSSNQYSLMEKTIGFDNITGTTSQIRGDISLNNTFYLAANARVKDMFKCTAAALAIVYNPRLHLTLKDY